MRTALVTGASRGIGRAIAEVLDQRGWRVFAVNVDPSRNADIVDSLVHGIGGVAVDLGEGGRAAAVVRAAADKVIESLDLLVLNAGIFIEGSLAESAEGDYRRNMAVNLDANVYLVRELLPLLRAGRRPRIVIIGSTAAYEPYPMVPTYGIAKWGLRGFALNLRRELMGAGIGVTLLSPGGTLTDMWAGEDVPPERLLEPHDVALLVVAITELSAQAVVEELVVRPMLGDMHE